MTHHLDLREPPTDLPALDFHLTDTDQAIARIARHVLEAQRIERNARDGAHATTA